MNATLKYMTAFAVALFLVSCEDSKTNLSKDSAIVLRNRASAPGTSADLAAQAQKKVTRLFEALTGTVLQDTNPLYAEILSLVSNKQMSEAAQKITHRYNGSKYFYNNVVANFSRPINRNHSVDEPLSDIGGLIVGVTRDDLTIDDLMFGNFYYRDPNPTSGGTPSQRAYPRIYTNGNQMGHYEYLALRGNLRDELVKETKGSGDVGLFTTHEWAKSYYLMGTRRRPWKGIVEHFYCQEHTSIKSIYIPDDFIRRDVARETGGDTSAFHQNCKGCHAQMDPISNVFHMFNFNEDDEVIIKEDTFIERINNKDNYPAGYAPEDDSWWIYSTDSQEQLLGFQNVAADGSGPAISFIEVGSGLKMATGKGLKDLVRTIARSKGYAHCLAERIVLQLVHKKVWSLATITSADRAKLEADKDLVNDIANELMKTRKLKKAFESTAIRYAERL